jgi:hypothetical protein
VEQALGQTCAGAALLHQEQWRQVKGVPSWRKYAGAADTGGQLPVPLVTDSLGSKQREISSLLGDYSVKISTLEVRIDRLPNSLGDRRATRFDTQTLTVQHDSATVRLVDFHGGR